MPIPMICPRDYTLRTKLGHVIRFEAGVPTPVPQAAYAEALAKNIVPAKRPDDDTPVFGMVHAEITGSLRDAMIYGAVDELVKRNQSEDFTGGGVPKAVSITAAIGIPVSATEVSRYWTNYREMVAENTELPSHPNVEVVRELQALSTRKQMEDFVEEHDLKLPATKGKSLKELKSLLLHAIIGQQITPAADPGEYKKPSSLTMD
jgi:hypothetical protein